MSFWVVFRFHKLYSPYTLLRVKAMIMMLLLWQMGLPLFCRDSKKDSSKIRIRYQMRKFWNLTSFILRTKSYNMVDDFWHGVISKAGKIVITIYYMGVRVMRWDNFTSTLLWAQVASFWSLSWAKRSEGFKEATSAQSEVLVKLSHRITLTPI